MASAAPIRKKRNFKALQLDVASQPIGGSQGGGADATAPVATRLAPAPGAKRKPPAMDLSKSRSTTSKSVSPVAPGSASSAPATASRPTYQTTLQQQLADLDMNSTAGGEGVEKFDVKSEDLKELCELGHGNGGSVKKVEHTPTGKIMAKKIVLIDAKPSVRKQILRELQFMHNCHSQYIVSFYGAFIADPNICICMEFMDKGSFDGVYKRSGPIPIDIVGKIAFGVLEGLIYLYDVHRIIHRDIKPSNMLLNSQGQIKICDFGVSGELINSVADTFVGTSTYMSPERIQGASYTVKSDVWSVGISLIELALGRFPFADSDDSDQEGPEDANTTVAPSTMSNLQAATSGASNASSNSSSATTPTTTTSPANQDPTPKKRGADSLAQRKKDRRKSKGVSLQGGGMTMSILELLQHIVNEPAPRLVPEDRFPEDARLFTDLCLLKDPVERPAPKELMNHAWIQRAKSGEVDLKAWAAILP